MVSRQRYAILEHLLTTPPSAASSSNSSFNTPISQAKVNNNSGKPTLTRYASFSNLIELTSAPLPKLSPREVDDVLGPNNAGLNVSLESIPPLFTPNNQCSMVGDQYHPHTISAPVTAIAQASPMPPGPPKRSCSAPAAHLPAPFPQPTPTVTAWRVGGVVRVSSASTRRPLSKSLITTSADILQSYEPISQSEGATRPIGVAVARSGSLQEVTSDLAEEARKRSILRLFPSLQQQQSRLLVATASSKPRPMAVVSPGRSGIHVDPLLCRVPGCDKLFRNAAARNLHYRESHFDETFGCSSCPIRLTSKNALDFHRRKKHQEFIRQSRECPVESCVRKFFVESRLLHHLRVHHGQRCLPCMHDECDAKFLTTRERERHMRNDHSASLRSLFFCTDCHREFPSRLLLNRHRRRIHRPAAKSLDRDSQTTLVDCGTNTCTPKSPAPASSSSSSSTSSISFVAPVSASYSSSTSSSSSSNAAKVPPCAICEAVFASWEQLSTHLAAHARLATDMFEQQQQQKRPRGKSHTAEIAVGTESQSQQVLLACPFTGCVTLCEDHRVFREHFAKHLGSEMPTVSSEMPVSAILPTDFFPAAAAASMPALPPFESPMEDTNCLSSFNDAETSSLFQALDLNLLSAITEVEDSGLLDQMLAPDLASALTLPDAGDPRSRCVTRTTYLDDPDFPTPGTIDDGSSCARTCPRLNQQMVELAKRRKALLLERVTLGFEPRPANPHLKDVMRQIFHSKALPSKYQVPLYAEEEEQEVSVTDCSSGQGSGGEGGAGGEALLAPLTDWMLPSDMLSQSNSDTPLDPPLLDQLL